MSENNEINDLESQSSDPRININMRVKSTLKNKIKDKMDEESKSPDDFFSDMFYAYLKLEAEKHGEVDYTPDLQDLEIVVKRVVTIYKNMVERSYMQSSISKENYSKELNELAIKLKEDYEKKIEKLNKENNKLKTEYELISEQATALIKDTKELRESYNLVKHTSDKNEELIKNYKEQIEGLKSTNIILERRLENTIDKSLLEKAEFEKEKALLEIEKQHQSVINNMNNNYNELQIKFSEQFSLINIDKKNNKE